MNDITPPKRIFRHRTEYNKLVAFDTVSKPAAQTNGTRVTKQHVLRPVLNESQRPYSSSKKPIAVLAAMFFGTSLLLSHSLHTNETQSSMKKMQNKYSRTAYTGEQRFVTPKNAQATKPLTPSTKNSPNNPVITPDQTLVRPTPVAVEVEPANISPTINVELPTLKDILPSAANPQTNSGDLSSPNKKDLAMQILSSAENSSTDWEDQYGYIEDIGDGRGYTGGIMGFTSGTSDMLALVRYYTKISPQNVLAQYIPALQNVDGSDSHAGLGSQFIKDWKSAAKTQEFQIAQNHERDAVYFNPALAAAKSDGLKALGQFIYFDALVMHGPGNDPVSFGGIRKQAISESKTPAQGGDESAYLNAFSDARVEAMKTEAAHEDVSRIETAQRLWVKAKNFDLEFPLSWKVYGESFSINSSK